MCITTFQRRNQNYIGSVYKCDSHAIKTLNMLTKVQKSNEDLLKSFTDLEKKFEDFIDKNHTPVNGTVKSVRLVGSPCRC